MMKIYDNGIVREMTEEEVASFMAEKIEEIKPSLEDEVKDLKKGLADIKELISPILKMFGGGEQR